MSITTNNRNQAEAFLRTLSDSGYEELCSKIKRDEPMSRHTTFRVGGPADLFAQPAGLLEVIALQKAAQTTRIPLMVVGNGSNLVISDDGMDGLVIHLGDALSRIWFEGDPTDSNSVLVHAFSGALLSQTAMACAKKGLAGMEFAAGIPGSIGGAVYMNAGAYGSQMSDVVFQSVSLTPEGEMCTLEKDQHDFGYRSSRYLLHGGTVLSVVLKLFYGDESTIMNRISELSTKRSASQPLNMPSAGSVFKRPNGHFAGTLIQEAGLKGYTIGGAQVSDKHAGFIVNTGNATAKEIKALMDLIIEKVKDNSGIILEPEIKFAGRGY